MGTMFWVGGVSYDPEDAETYVSVTYSTCADIFQRLRLVGDPVGGELRARDLRLLCKQALESEEAKQDDSLPEVHEGRYHFMGRPAGRINMRIEQLLKLCESAGELGLIYWG